MKMKKAQEEMIGFALIIVLVSVILLAFLGFSLSKPQVDLLESYEVENFLQASLQYTTDCEKRFADFASIQDLVFECDLDNNCLDERSSCVVLNDTLRGLLMNVWPVGEDRPSKGYELTISVEDGSEYKLISSIKEGNITRGYKGAIQPLPKSNIKKTFDVVLKVYY